MARPRARAASREFTTEALLLRRVPTGDADDVVALFTERVGRVSAFTRGSRRSQKRFGGALEPLHTLRVQLEEHDGRELFTLKEATLARPRSVLLSQLDAMQAAGKALSWVRRATPARTPEPLLWQRLELFLDGLGQEGAATGRLLSAFGFGLLDAVGFGLLLGQCVVCGKPCPSGRRVQLDVARGGVVCQGCGGARIGVSAALRQRLVAAADGQLTVLLDEDTRLARELVELSLRLHAGVE